MTTYNPKQKDFLKRVQNNTLSRINLLEGSVSSGKTWISLVAWAFWVAKMPKQGLYMMCAKTLATLKNNCLLPLQDLIGESNFVFIYASVWLWGLRFIAMNDLLPVIMAVS